MPDTVLTKKRKRQRQPTFNELNPEVKPGIPSTLDAEGFAIEMPEDEKEAVRDTLHLLHGEPIPQYQERYGSTAREMEAESEKAIKREKIEEEPWIKYEVEKPTTQIRYRHVEERPGRFRFIEERVERKETPETERFREIVASIPFLRHLLKRRKPIEISSETEGILGLPFVRRMMKATRPFTPFEKDIEETRIKEDTRRFKQNRELDAMAGLYYTRKEGAEVDSYLKRFIGSTPSLRKFWTMEAPELKEEVRRFVLAQPWSDRERLIRRFDRYGRIFRIPDRRWWLNVGDLPPEQRAEMFWRRYQKAGEEEKARLKEYLGKVPGIFSQRFAIRLAELQGKGE